LATNSKNFKVKNSIEVNGDSAIGGNVNLYDSSGYIQLKASDGFFYSLSIENDGSLSTYPVFFSLEYLVVAGGGGGGQGGGGAGGYRSNVTGENSGGGASAEAALNVNQGVTYAVTVGAGGASLVNGNLSQLNTIISLGGGKGATFNISPGDAGTGGSGGGAANTYSGPVNPGGNGTSGQGYNGGNAFYNYGNSGDRHGGGGGGAGQLGGSAATNKGGDGGNGVLSSITGSNVTRAGGGGGSNVGGNYFSTAFGVGGIGGGGNGYASNSGNDPSSNGQVNTGGGAGMNRVGGSGVVILKYPNIFTATFSAGVTATTTTVGDFKVSQVTATSTTSETVTFS